MLALLHWELAEITINGRLISSGEEESLLGRTFEKLGQDRRIRVLQTYRLISDQVRTDLELIRVTRNKYLHLWSQDHGNLPKDAVTIFRAAVRVTVAVLGQKIDDGKFILQSQLLKYLQRRGLVTVLDEPTATSSGDDGDAGEQLNNGAETV